MLNAAVDLVLPPMGVAFVALACLALGGRVGRGAALVCVVVLLVLALPVAAGGLLGSLAPGPVSMDGPPQAIVILSAEGIPSADGDTLIPGPLSLERMQTGAALALQTRLPVLVSGGAVAGSSETLAQMMKRTLEQSFKVDVKWTEDRSRDTWENAAFSAEILRRQGVSRVYLVTHEWHMRRALIAFRHAKLQALPASVVDPRGATVQISEFLPRPKEWYDSYLAMHEWVGTLYYLAR